MKKKNAFTLIELLAVIVILAIIALIAVPQIMKILYEARLHAAEDATYGMIKSTENFLANQVLLNDAEKSNYEFKCYKNGVCKDSVEKDEDDETVYPEYILDYKGKKIIGGEINVLNNELIQVDEIIAFGFKCSKDYDEEIVHCTPLDGTEVYYNEGQTEEVVVDNNPGIICGDTNVEQYDSMTECHIKSMEDWNEFKKLVDTENKNFQNKKVILDVNLSFSGLTYQEIGTSTNFKGTFFGRNKTLSDITINSESDSSGIFRVNEGNIEYLKLNNIKVIGNAANAGSLVGLNNGTVNAITATNIDVTGNGITGILVGKNANTVKNVMVSGSVTGTNYVGGVMGYNNQGTSAHNLYAKDVDVTSTSNTEYIGGLSGGDYYMRVYGVVEKATITSSGGSISCLSHSNGTGLCSNQIVINGTPQNGFTIGDGMLPIYNTYLDTYIDGDDGDGYYFDYDKHGNIIIKSTEEDPTEFNLQGDGSENNPYLISNSKEWKQAVLRANETDAHFKITKDINFNNIPTYPISTLAGTLYGDNHTLSNLTLYGTDAKMGLVMQNNGTIEYLKLDNIKITGNAENAGSLVGINNGTVNAITTTNIDVNGSVRTGVLVGRNANTVKNVIVSGKSTGINFVGGVMGYNNQGTTAHNLYAKDVVVTSTASTDYIGGLSGGDYYMRVYGVVEKATITSVGGSISCLSHSNGTGLCSNQIIINGNPQNGYVVGETMLPIYNPYMDSYIDGDDGDGYYFDYDTDGKIIIKSTKYDPIEFNLQGDGSENNPYLISNANDWKQAVLRANETGAYFKITRDINFNNVPTYPISTLAGTLYGDNHTLSNLTLYGTDSKMGIVMQNNGTIEYLKLDNITITGNAQNAGSLVGINNGTVNAITTSNIDVTGNGITGVLVGKNANTVKNVIVSGKATGTNRVGGVMGYNNQGTTAHNLYAKDVVVTSTSNPEYIGGLSGGDYFMRVYGVVEKATITSSGGSISCLSHAYGTGLCSNQVVINDTPQNGYVVGETMLPIYNPYMDTYIDGDDGDGYYFDYDNNGKIIIKSTKYDPIEFNLQGNGTESNPYLIGSVSDWKQAVLRANETGAHFKITKDINFNNVPTYPMSTLAGTLYGDNHTLSNLTLYGTDSKMGIVMQNNGTIEYLKLDNITITGNAQNAGSLVGINNGTVNAITTSNIDVTGNGITGVLVGKNANTVKNVIVSGKATGTNRVGGVMGYNNQGTTANNLYAKDVVVTSTSNPEYIGGLSGGDYYMRVTGIVEKAKITTSGGSISCLSHSNGAGLCSNQIVINDTPQNGYTVGETMLPIYNSYLDTYIDGDDGDGYYFDYDNNGKIIIKSTKYDPIEFNLQGNGTESNPYLIGSVSDWKKAVLKSGEQGVYYKITNDINFNNVFTYPFYIFKGNLNGDNHTLSNIKLYGTDSIIGIFMQNNGTIENLKISNVTITGNAQNAGSLVGLNNGVVKAVTTSNIDVTGSSITGVLVGKNANTVKNVIVSGKATGTNRVGGVMGYNNQGTTASNLYAKDVVVTSTSNPDYIGGLSGGDYYMRVTGIVEKATITSSGGSISCLSHANGAGLCSNQVFINGNQQSGYTVGNNMLSTYSTYLEVDVDTDSDGYFFGYDSSNNIIIKKA